MKAIFVIFTLIFSTHSFANKITIGIGLTPAGSFQAISNKAKGNVIKHGDAFTADKISVNIESFKTGIDLRDEHTWRHLNSTKYPRAVFSDVKGQNGKATGKLDINGVKKPVNIFYSVSGNELKAKFSVKASEFSLPEKEYLGVVVNDIINVEAVLPFKTR
jgi:polyisoprenoid-binding protein YceI